MVNPIIQFNPSDFVVWGRKNEDVLPLPANPWLRRRRESGIPFEVERLFSCFCAEYGRCQPDKKEVADNLFIFLSSEYRRNEVYYRFINMRIGIRRMAVYMLKRYVQETKDVGRTGSSAAV